MDPQSWVAPIGAADTPRNGNVRGTSDGDSELLCRSNNNALRLGIDDDGNGILITAPNQGAFRRF